MENLTKESIRLVLVILRIGIYTSAVFGLVVLVLTYFGYNVNGGIVSGVFILSISLFGLRHFLCSVNISVGEHRFAKECQCEVCKNEYPGPLLTFMKFFFLVR
jgi:hypothetical protein